MDISFIEPFASALIGSLATLVVGWFTFRSQLKEMQVKGVKDNNDFILEVQKQTSIEREQMNEQRLQDSKAINGNMAMINSFQQQITQIQKEVSEWRTKYFDLSNKYTELQAEHVELQKKFSNLKGQITQMRNQN